MDDAPRFQTTAAHAATWFLWGATFLGIRVAVETTPPLWMAAQRFLIAAAFLTTIAALLGPRTKTCMPWHRAAATGALLFLIPHGIISTLQVRIPSGIAAVAMAAIPLWLALFARQPAQRMPWIGLALGFGGVVVLAWPSETVRPLDAALLMVASLSWAIGSLLTQRWMEGRDPVRSVARQGLSAAAMLAVASLVYGEPWRAATGPSAAAILFLAIGGSTAYYAYTYLLRNTTAARASSYAYVNPVVAVALGALVGEPVTWRLVVATPMVVAAVYAVLVPRRAGSGLETRRFSGARWIRRVEQEA